MTCLRANNDKVAGQCSLDIVITYPLQGVVLVSVCHCDLANRGVKSRRF